MRTEIYVAAAFDLGRSTKTDCTILFAHLNHFRNKLFFGKGRFFEQNAAAPPAQKLCSSAAGIFERLCPIIEKVFCFLTTSPPSNARPLIKPAALQYDSSHSLFAAMQSLQSEAPSLWFSWERNV
jgi:hypothetical protein